MNKFTYVLRHWGTGVFSWITFVDVDKVHDIEAHYDTSVHVEAATFFTEWPQMMNEHVDGLVIEVEERLLSDLIIKGMQAPTPSI